MQSWPGRGPGCELGDTDKIMILKLLVSYPLIWHLYSVGHIFKQTGFNWVDCPPESLGLGWRVVTKVELAAVCGVRKAPEGSVCPKADPELSLSRCSADWSLGRV